MTKATDLLAAQMVRHISDGEDVLAATVVAHTGGAMRFGGMLGGPVVGAIAGRYSRKADGTAGLVPANAESIFALTNQRVVFFRYRLGDRVGDPLNSIPLDAVHEIEARAARIGTGNLHLAFSDGSAMRLDLDTDKEADTINQAATALLKR